MGEYIKTCWEDICEEFAIEKNKIVAITTDGGTNIVNNYTIPCMTHPLNHIVDGVLRKNHVFSALCNHVKSFVTYFKQSVNALELLRSEQEVSGKKEGIDTSRHHKMELVL